MNESKIYYKTGIGLLRRLSKDLYPNINYVFDELVSNSYDADATSVRIGIEKNRMFVFDGIGG